VEFIYKFVDIFFDILSFAILARVLMSWLPQGSGGQLSFILKDITEPIMGPFRRIIPRVGMVDISPIVVILFIDFSKKIVLQILILLM